MEDRVVSRQDRIEIIYGVTKILKTTIDCLDQTKQRWDICSYANGAFIFDTLWGLKLAHVNAMNRGLKLRFMIEITKGNSEMVWHATHSNS